MIIPSNIYSKTINKLYLLIFVKNIQTIKRRKKIFAEDTSLDENTVQLSSPLITI